jgi:hypothetical protein
MLLWMIQKKIEFNKKILVNFEWWEITWNAWLLVIEEFFDKLWIKKLLKKYGSSSYQLGKT